MEMTFTAVFEEIPTSEGGGFLAFAEELPGAITQGDSLEEARENLRDAIEQVLEANRSLSGEKLSGHRIVREKISIPVS
jgi:predicted RNase H-like HicB family nuclease